MLRPAVRLTVAALAAVSMLPTSTAVAGAPTPSPNPHLSQVLAEPPSTGYVELASHTPGILEGPFDAGTYASIGGIDMQSSITTLAQDGFIAGYGRAWVQQAPNRVLVEIVVAFTGGPGAKRWLRQSQMADLTDPTFQHSITVDGIETYYGARMSDSSSYFADAFVFVKGNDGFLVSTISSFDDLGDSAAMQTRVQYRHAPAYTIPPSGWPGAPHTSFSVADATLLAARITAVAAAFGALWWTGLMAARRWRRRRGYDSSGR
ncbi:MAG TPA: hypothetical protein VGV88_03530 [Candidatus Dormibacteraeota bacterium]|nr:hypothetical protein [Candidatus Dormibacteraeota bacterium]